MLEARVTTFVHVDHYTALGRNSVSFVRASDAVISIE